MAFHPASSHNYTSRSVGVPNTPGGPPALTPYIRLTVVFAEHRIFILHDGHVVSALHDVPLLPGPRKGSPSTCALPPAQGATELILTMIVEAPRWSTAQTALAPSEAYAPIRPQLKRARRPARVRSVFPHHGYIWNYGALPQVRLLPNPFVRVVT